LEEKFTLLSGSNFGVYTQGHENTKIFKGNIFNIFMPIETHPQYFALELEIELGRNLQGSHPDILKDMYRAGFSQNEIGKHMLEKRIGISSLGVAEKGVRNALRGCSEYLGLLSEEEYTAISENNRIAIGKTNAENCRINGSGIYGLSSEEHADNSRKAARARGQVPYSEPEIELMMKLYFDRVSYRKNAETLNKNFHGNSATRSRDSVISAIKREKNKKL